MLVTRSIQIRHTLVRLAIARNTVARLGQYAADVAAPEAKASGSN